MKRILSLIVLTVALLACLAGCAKAPDNSALQDKPSSPATSQKSSDAQPSSNKTGKITIVASMYPMYDFAQKIGGDRVEVTNIVPAGVEPHDWEPSPSDMRTIAQAKMLIFNGAGMEEWIDDVVESAAHKDLVLVEASKGVNVRKVEDQDEDHDHDKTGHHKENHHHDTDKDPHVWLSPKNALIEMTNIKDALITLDPQGKDMYEANFKTYAQKLEELDKTYQSKLAGVASHNLVVSHQAFGYLCEAYGLEQKPIMGLEADSEPDARTMAHIVDFVKANNVKVIFTEELVSPKIAQAIADATQASIEVLSPIEGLTQEQINAGEDYFSLMNSNLEKLVKALS